MLYSESEGVSMEQRLYCQMISSPTEWEFFLATSPFLVRGCHAWDWHTDDGVSPSQTTENQISKGTQRK